jgi:hypothetical protein
MQSGDVPRVTLAATSLPSPATRYFFTALLAFPKPAIYTLPYILEQLHTEEQPHFLSSPFSRVSLLQFR